MLGNKPGSCYYWYNDDYMNFTFKGIHSSIYNLFIQNSKELTIENTVGASSEYVNALLQEGTYYLGTSRKQKTFKRKCAAEGLTLEQYKGMMQWLTVGTTGELVFDSNKFWGWTVVLDTVGDATFVGNNEFLIVEFELTFKTIGTYLAHSIYPGTWISDSNEPVADAAISNEYNIPVVISSEEYAYDDNIKAIDFYIQNICNQYQNFNLLLTAVENGWNGSYKIGVNEINSAITIKSTKEQSNVYLLEECEYDDSMTNYLQAEFSATDTDLSFVEADFSSGLTILNVNNMLAEENAHCVKTIQPNGIMRLKSKCPEHLNCQIHFINGSLNYKDFNIVLSEEEWNKFITYRYNYIVISKNIPLRHLYNVGGYTIDSIGPEYIADYKTLIILPPNNSNNGFDNITNLIDKNKNCAYIKSCQQDGTNYIITCSTKSSNLNWASNDDDFNNCKMYCGYNHHIRLIIESNTGDNNAYSVQKKYVIQIQSYNNL